MINEIKMYLAKLAISSLHASVYGSEGLEFTCLWFVIVCACTFLAFGHILSYFDVDFSLSFTQLSFRGSKI